ncbi:hypothetical protein FQN54_001062 [Arachnomyces sp. PD_36]|nr:hypothetical protein FQN54_001062 [Arachnomyces sp. PD_36]
MSDLEIFNTIGTWASVVIGLVGLWFVRRREAMASGTGGTVDPESNRMGVGTTGGTVVDGSGAGAGEGMTNGERFNRIHAILREILEKVNGADDQLAGVSEAPALDKAGAKTTTRGAYRTANLNTHPSRSSPTPSARAVKELRRKPLQTAKNDPPSPLRTPSHSASGSSRAPRQVENGMVNRNRKSPEVKPPTPSSSRSAVAMRRDRQRPPSDASPPLTHPPPHTPRRPTPPSTEKMSPASPKPADTRRR